MHVPRFENDKVDVVAKLAASLILPDEREIQISIGKCHLLASALDQLDEIEETNVVSILEVKEEPDQRPPSLSTSCMVTYPLTQRKG